jgi:hypothetical protein
MDSVFFDRLWWGLKYEKIRLYSYTKLKELRENVTEWMKFYNHERDHQGLDYTKLVVELRTNAKPKQSSLTATPGYSPPTPAS